MPGFGARAGRVRSCAVSEWTQRRRDSSSAIAGAESRGTRWFGYGRSTVLITGPIIPTRVWRMMPRRCGLAEAQPGRNLLTRSR